jgi:D-aminoacyl-tRNA deacylase
MKFIIQRVAKAEVEINHTVVGKIQRGYLVFVGITNSDTIKTADKMIQKLLNLRIFPDENDKINYSIIEISGQLLFVSQFTLYADCKKGNRPSFTDAGNPHDAKKIYEYIILKSGEYVPSIQSGVFGEDMLVSLCNDGPFTIVLDSNDLIQRI